MTRHRGDAHSTEFGLWLRCQPEIDSKLGFVTTNLDYVWHNYKTGEWMLIEEKRYGRFPSACQSGIYHIVTDASENDPLFRGYHFIQFEKTSPEDGDVFVDGQKVSRQELIAFLQFEAPHVR